MAPGICVVWSNPVGPDAVEAFEAAQLALVQGAATARSRFFREASEQLLPHRAADPTHRHVAVHEADDIADLVAGIGDLLPTVAVAAGTRASVFRTILDTTEATRLSDGVSRPDVGAIPPGPPGIFLPLTRPVSDTTDAEFNQWYDDHHVPDVLLSVCFSRARRFRVVDDPLPVGVEPLGAPYVAIYEVDNVASIPANRSLQPWIGEVGTLLAGPDGYDKTFTTAYVYEQL